MGALPNTQDSNYRRINENYPVFAYAQDFGKVGSQAQSMLLQLSLHQENCMQFQGEKDMIAKVPCLWKSYFSRDTDAVSESYKL
jgi:hypothetical protein